MVSFFNIMISCNVRLISMQALSVCGKQRPGNRTVSGRVRMVVRCGELYKERRYGMIVSRMPVDVISQLPSTVLCILRALICTQ